jgi:hypothetical protein
MASVVYIGKFINLKMQCLNCNALDRRKGMPSGKAGQMSYPALVALLVKTIAVVMTPAIG